MSDWVNLEKIDIFSDSKTSIKKENQKSISDEFLKEENFEEFYENKLSKEPWIINNNYLNKNEVFKNLPSLHYFDKHISSLEQALPKTNFLKLIGDPNFHSQPTTKKICRKGIPPSYMKKFLLNLFGIKKIDENNYKNTYSLIFKNHNTKNLGDFVPYFSDKKTLNENLPFHYLNNNGIEELKIILWMICDNHRNIAFSPILVKLISLFLIFCNKYETYEIVCKLIEQEKKNEEKENNVRWRLKFSYDDNKKFISSIAPCLKEIGPKNKAKYYKNLDYIYFKVEELYEDMYFNFFFNYLNFYGIIRLLPIYLIEGIKCIYKLIFVLENEIYQINFKYKTEVIQKVRDKCKKINNIQELFNNSFKVKLNKFNCESISKNSLDNNILNNQRNDFYLPYFNGGNLLTDREIIHLWEILPFEYKIKNAKIIYQASKDGYNLPNIISLEDKYNKKTNTLFLIETEKGEKFGFISSNLIIHTDNNYQRPDSSFLFTICPKYNIYNAHDSEEILYVTSKDFIFGNGANGPAIQLNQDLKEGDSYSGGCFNNPCLVDEPNGHFKVQKLEIFQLE